MYLILPGQTEDQLDKVDDGEHEAEFPVVPQPVDLEIDLVICEFVQDDVLDLGEEVVAERVLFVEHFEADVEDVVAYFAEGGEVGLDDEVGV